jgi:predicted RNase H-like HicB family nuclease
VNRYLILIEAPPEPQDLGAPGHPLDEQPAGNYSAYAPDLPGCVATGDTREETEQLMREAIELHLEDLRAKGDAVPEPATSVAYVEVA